MGNLKLFFFFKFGESKDNGTCHCTLKLNIFVFRTVKSYSWAPFFKHLAAALSVQIDQYDPIVYHDLLQFFFDVFNMETLMKHEKIAKVRNLFINHICIPT